MTPRLDRRWRTSGFLVVIALAIGVAWWFLGSVTVSYDPPPLSFDDGSDQVQQTVIVPTLDSPIPDGRSAVWCASFQLAWNRLKEDVAKGPVQLANAPSLADKLNRGNPTEADLEPGSGYTAAGLVGDGIVDRIRAEMASRFPNVPAPAFNVPADGAVAYAYLAASVKFDFPFFENDEPLLFTDSTGKQTAVGSFGIRKKDDYAYRRLREQVEILYLPQNARGREQRVPEYIVDPCKTSRPYQVVLARMSREPTLADTLAEVEQKLATRDTKDSYAGRLGQRDSLLVPNLAWRISHHFKELAGKDKQFANPTLRGLFLDTAWQTIQFRLNRSGAELASEARIPVSPAATYLEFDRPFLVLLKKRGGQQPCFVMWIDNAELLQQR